MKDALTKVLRATEIFEERLCAIIHKDDIASMQKLAEEFKTKNISFEDFEIMLCDFANCIMCLKDTE